MIIELYVKFIINDFRPSDVITAQKIDLDNYNDTIDSFHAYDPEKKGIDKETLESLQKLRRCAIKSTKFDPDDGHFVQCVQDCMNIVAKCVARFIPLEIINFNIYGDQHGPSTYIISTLLRPITDKKKLFYYYSHEVGFWNSVLNDTVLIGPLIESAQFRFETSGECKKVNRISPFDISNKLDTTDQVDYKRRIMKYLVEYFRNQFLSAVSDEAYLERVKGYDKTAKRRAKNQEMIREIRKKAEEFTGKSIKDIMANSANSAIALYQIKEISKAFAESAESEKYEAFFAEEIVNFEIELFKAATENIGFEIDFDLDMSGQSLEI